jgi:hypothetical protein
MARELPSAIVDAIDAARDDTAQRRHQQAHAHLAHPEVLVISAA